MHTKILLALGAAALLAPVPAHAHDGSGGHCGIALARASTSLTELPSGYSGVLTGGPWVAADPTTTSVSISCALQANSAEAGTNVIYTVSVTSPGPAGGFVSPVAITPAADDAIYLCTTVHSVNASGTSVHTVDANPSLPGVQCRRVV